MVNEEEGEDGLSGLSGIFLILLCTFVLDTKAYHNCDDSIPLPLPPKFIHARRQLRGPLGMNFGGVCGGGGEGRWNVPEFFG